MLTGLKLKKIKWWIIWGWFVHSHVAVATSSVPSLNQCPDMIFIDGNEDDSAPSGGSGGSFPGSLQQTILGDKTYYYYIPTSYQPSEPMPLIMVWHGQAGAGNADFAAQNMLGYWQNEAEARDFIVVAQVATGPQFGSWVPTTDSQIMGAILDDMENRYNIETTRRYLYGFSAGGFVMHAIALNNADIFAAYAISGAHLGFATGSGYTPAGALRQLPVFISVGQSDTHYQLAQADLNTFISAGWQQDVNLWFDDFVGGHQLLPELPAKAWNKICIATITD